MIVAVTGATGFVGRAVVDRSAGSGLSLRALTRRAQPSRAGITWIAGALDKPDSLATLVEGADAVLHIAGVVNAPDRAGFVAGNIDGTRAIVEAAKAAGIKRFVHVSSLSAREPALSTYGWSKRQAEAIVTDSGLDWTIVRPSGIYGPGDMEMRDMFLDDLVQLGLGGRARRHDVVQADEDFAGGGGGRNGHGDRAIRPDAAVSCANRTQASFWSASLVTSPSKMADPGHVSMIYRNRPSGDRLRPP